MKLTIVIPALNEEAAIGPIIERTLAARPHIIARSPVSAVQIIVVSDGSTDRTADIAAAFAAAHDGVELIRFPVNRGYGAAIKAGFERGDGDLLGFLDADGTCDPAFFADLCSALAASDAAVALGSRLGPQSQMPVIRRLGNRAYAFILSVLSNRPVTDTASGMRVMRRAALDPLGPLPDRLNFTPAMSARVLMDDRLRIVEIPMPYRERVGQSKLNVLRDGLEFLRTIAGMALVWRPSRMFAAAAALCWLGMIVLIAHPAEMWLRAGRLEEDMIYRLLFCSLLGSFGSVLLSATVLTESLHEVFEERPRPRSFASVVLDRFYTVRSAGAVIAAALPLQAALVGPGVITLIGDGHVTIHWSRAVLAGMLAFVLVQMFVTTLILNVIRFHAPRRRARVLAEGTATVTPAAAVAMAVPIVPAAT